MLMENATPKTNIARLLAAFHPARLQELMALQAQLTRAGLTMDDVRRYLEALLAAQARRLSLEEDRQRRYYANARRCPACNAVMQLYPVNTGPRDRVGGNWRSQWACPDRTCMETIFNRESVERLLRDMGIQPPPARATTVKPKGGCCNGAT